MKTISEDVIKKLSIGVLDYIDTVCKDNGLRYYLCGGTLLGAVRHKGFIPWDDDIDIMMPREDYERLFLIWPKNSFYSALYYKNTRDWSFAYGKVIDTRTYKRERFVNKYNLGGVDVDVFPIDNLPNDDVETIAFYNEIDKIQKRLDNHKAPYRKGKTPLRSFVRLFPYIALRICDYFGMNIRRIVKKFDELSRGYNTVSTDFCGITAISHYGIKEKNPKSNYESVVYVTFEGKKYPAISGYADYLQRLYGKNYMELPPIEKRVTHHDFTVYWK